MFTSPTPPSSSSAPTEPTAVCVSDRVRVRYINNVRTRACARARKTDGERRTSAQSTSRWRWLRRAKPFGCIATMAHRQCAPKASTRTWCLVSHILEQVHNKSCAWLWCPRTCAFRMRVRLVLVCRKVEGIDHGNISNTLPADWLAAGGGGFPSSRTDHSRVTTHNFSIFPRPRRTPCINYHIYCAICVQARVLPGSVRPQFNLEGAGKWGGVGVGLCNYAICLSCLPAPAV